MQRSVSLLFFFTSIILTIILPSMAQVPTGALRGTVTDPSKAVISGATVTVKNKGTGAERIATSKTDGDFLINNLLPGEYEVKVTMSGFKTNLSSVTVQVGDTVTTEIALEIGQQSETVVVSGDSTAVVNTSDFKVDGVITRQKIDNLPLNGRNYLTLASLEPGVRVSTSNPGDANSLVNVSIGGAASELTRLTVDGGSIVDYTTGGAGQNFSIESVQEFQISSFNFDMATGVTSVGAINIVTRTGANNFFGSAFAFYRDHNIAAYPLLKRNQIDPDPFFRRLQSGFSVGGPIKKDKLLWFFNLEKLNQDAVFSTIHTGYKLSPTLSPLSQFDTVTLSPFDETLTNARMDYRLNNAHSFFVRYSGDNNKTFAPVTTNTLPSDWRTNKNDSYQGQGSWTWIARPTLTNDLRFNWQYVGNRSLIPTSSDCPNCIGLGGPQIRINNSNFRIGNEVSAPQNRAQHRYETTDNVTWTKGKHSVQFGGTWEKDYGLGNWNFAEPAVIVVHDPADVLAINGFIDLLANPNTPGIGPLLAPIFGPVAPALRIPLPASFVTPGARITYQDILQLPVAGAAVGIGDGSQPPPFNVNIARNSQRFRLYGQDTWRIKPNLSLKYGLSYTYETNLYNHDLPKSTLFQSLTGTAEANGKKRDNFAPAAGFAWDVKNNAKTVIRGGASMFYDTSLFVNRLTERALLGPLGNGRVQVPNDFFANSTQFANLPPQFVQSLPVIVGQLNQIAGTLPANDPTRAQLLAIANQIPALLLLNPALGSQLTSGALQTIPTKFTGANFVTAINQQVPLVLQQFQALGNQGVKGIDFFKTASDPLYIIDPNAKIPYSIQFSLGMQRELPFNMLVTADFVYRHRVHTYFQADRALYNRADSLGGSVIPRCTSANSLNPTARCLNGPLEIFEASGRETYKALLVKLDKRFSRRFAFTASYALSSSTGFPTSLSTPPFRQLTNLFGDPGPIDRDARHIFAFNGVVDLPKGFQVGFIANINSRGPFSPTLPGTSNSDINGDGTNNDLIPGFGFNQGNRSLNESDLVKLVTSYNQNFAGKPAPRGGLFPTVTLPSSFKFGDAFQSYDMRLSKVIKFRERFSLELIGEVFNIFNISNLTDFSGRLDADFGQPTNKAGQAFGYGGPRALQFAGRFKF